MIKIEIITRKSVNDVAVEREYRAELPDNATAEQIAAASNEAMSMITERQINEAANEAVGNAAEPTIGGWTKK